MTLEHRRLNNISYRRRNRMKVLIAYSGEVPECACCGATDYEFLSIDHINNDGNKERKLHGSSSNFYIYLIRNNFPPGYQILCHNCNLSKGFYGICPHKKLST